MKKNVSTVFIFIIIVCTSNFCFSQNILNIKDLVTQTNQFQTNHTAEKIYLHTDKPNYDANDTLWFKAYIFDANNYLPTNKSGILYLELANDSNVVIRRIMLPVSGGLSLGNISLNKDEFKQGSYIIRAYTNWMRNFDEHTIFQKQFYINHFNNNEWLINYSINQRDSIENSYGLNLNVRKFEGTGLILNDLELELTDGKNRVFKEKLKTDIGGNIDVNFKLPEKVEKKNLMFTLSDLRKTAEQKTYSFPLALNTINDIDLQFMPESGQLIDGIPSKVGFKALNSLGLGTTVSGELFEVGNPQKILDFESSHNGIGDFYFTPVYGKSYYAKLISKDRSVDSKTYQFPQIKKEGIVITVDNKNDADSIGISIHKKGGLINEFYFMAKARDIICYGSKLVLTDGVLAFKLNKNLFPTGVTSLIIINPNKEIINQRLVYIDHQDDLNIDFTLNKVAYQQRDSVILELKVTDSYDLPVSGNFSLSVTDDFYVKQDSLKYNSMSTFMNLYSHLKGNIENAGYYAHAVKDNTKWKNLDNLLLTQGWTSYVAENRIDTTSKFDFEIEKEFLIKGKVTNVFNKPVVGSGITLLSKKPVFFADSKTDSVGRFYFKDIFPVDTAVFFIQAKNRREKSFNIGIEMEEFVPPVFNRTFEPIIPWNVNIDNSLQLRIKQQVTLNKNKDFKLSGNVIKEVIVTAKKIVKDSKNINGSGEADLVLDEQAIEKLGNITLGDLMRAKIKGIHVFTDMKSGQRYYRIGDKMLHIIIDGIDIMYAAPETSDLAMYFNQYFNYYNADDIKGVELMKSARYAEPYVTEYLPGVIPFVHAFVEITTRSGSGPFLKKTPGICLYKPMAFTLPKQFYSPKYLTKTNIDMTDLRSTIYWNPNFETDLDGVAILKFYTSDHVGNYSLVMEGTDKAGFFGSKQSMIKVIERK